MAAHSPTRNHPLGFLEEMKSLWKWRRVKYAVTLCIIVLGFTSLMLSPDWHVPTSVMNIIDFDATAIRSRFDVARMYFRNRLADGAASMDSWMADDVQNLALDRPGKFDPYPDWYNSPIIDPQSKLLFCWIPKNACTQFKALLCRRNQPFNETLDKLVSVLHLNSIHNKCKYWFHRFFILKDKPGKEMPQIRKGKLDKNGIIWPTSRWQIWNDKTWKKWVVLRNPFERIISAWVNKCGTAVHPKQRNKRCYGCDTDFECFAMENLRYMREFSLMTNSTDFTNYTNYDHFYPQYWSCDFKSHYHRYRTFTYSNEGPFRYKMRQEFLNANWPPEIINEGWGTNQKLPFLAQVTKNKASQVEKYAIRTMIRSNIQIADALFQTYFVDFMMFKFPVPRWCLDLCREVKEQRLYALCRWFRLE